MTKSLKSFEFIIGLAGGVGTNFKKATQVLEQELIKADCYVVHIPEIKNNETSYPETYAYQIIDYIFHQRLSLIKSNKRRIVYLVSPLAYVEEYMILRQVYHKNFVLLAVYESPISRVQNLGKVLKEENSGGIVHDIYHKAHYFSHMEFIEEDIKRFVALYFNAPFITPTKDELCMMHAYVSSLRSSATSRQVGAVIADEDGNILSSGSNEVPKFGGGLCWEDTYPDLRDFKTVDKSGVTLAQIIKIKKAKEHAVSEIKDSLEYFRTVDAEEASICDAARRGISIQSALMYSTTFPCHLCAKSIIASGIKKVIYIEPYPKSLSQSLFEGLLKDNALEHETHLVQFVPFRGVAPKRFKYLFKKSKKDRRVPDKKIKIVQWALNESLPIHVFNFNPLVYFWSEYVKLQKYYEQSHLKKSLEMVDALNIFNELFFILEKK